MLGRGVQLSPVYPSNWFDLGSTEGYQHTPGRRTATVCSRDSISKQLEALTAPTNGTEHLGRLAGFLANVPSAWEMATPDQRNKLTRCLFDQIPVELVGRKRRVTRFFGEYQVQEDVDVV